jgi:hypothetical protein
MSEAADAEADVGSRAAGGAGDAPPRPHIEPAPAPVTPARSPGIRSRSAAFPRSAERIRMARELLEDGRAGQGFWRFKPGTENTIKPVPDDYEQTLAFEPDISRYFGYRIDYYPFFDEFNRIPLRRTTDPRRWTYFVDINDEIVEEKFQTDQDIRAFITGFRISVELNRWRIIWLKRFIQLLNVILCFAPAVLVAFWPFLVQSGLPLRNPSLFVVGVIGGLYALALFGFTSLALWFQRVREGQLSVVIGNNGKTLASALQRRANNLSRNFVAYLARIDAEEATKRMSDSSWTDRAAWWMKLCLWSPKRIEYIEKFLQSEMQRIRVFMLRSAWQGYAIAYGVLIGSALVAALLVLAEVGIEWLLRGPKLGELAPLGLYLVGLGFAGWFTNRSLLTSVTLRDISEPLGEEPMGEEARFSDAEFDTKLAEQIRKDKEKIRQAFLRGGGFGDGSGRG